MAEQKLEIKIGRAYQLKDGRIGKLKFEGKTFFKPGVVWYGFELSAEFDGKNNGSVSGVPYFKCKKGKGVFVKRNKIEKMVANSMFTADARKVERKKGALETGRSEYDAAEFEIPDDGGDLNTQRVKKSSNKHLDKSAKKAGPREIGKSDYKAEKYDVEIGVTKDDDLNAERVTHRKDAGKSKKKAGPREIGKADYKAEKYDVEIGVTKDDDLNAERVKHRKDAGKSKKKAGPREIGKADYKAEKYDVEIGVTKDDDLNAERVKHRKDAGKAKKKEGPREIGTSDYNPGLA